jgi:hypothetical protein
MRIPVDGLPSPGGEGQGEGGISFFCIPLLPHGSNEPEGESLGEGA